MCDNCGSCEVCDLKRSLKATSIIDPDIGKPDTMASTYKLTYFPITGLAEPIRFLLSYGGIEFEDVRCENENWTTLKASMPFGQLPVLEVDGKRANQNIAIARYVAKKVKLIGKDDWEDLEIDAVVDTFNDLRIKTANYFYESDPTLKASLKEPLLNETMPYYLERLNNIATENGGHLAVGRLTWADLYFTALLGSLCHYAEKDIIAGYQSLQMVRDTVLALAPIKDWIEKRPKSEF